MLYKHFSKLDLSGPLCWYWCDRDESLSHNHRRRPLGTIIQSQLPNSWYFLYRRGETALPESSGHVYKEYKNGQPPEFPWQAAAGSPGMWRLSLTKFLIRGWHHCILNQRWKEYLELFWKQRSRWIWRKPIIRRKPLVPFIKITRTEDFWDTERDVSGAAVSARRVSFFTVRCKERMWYASYARRICW